MQINTKAEEKIIAGSVFKRYVEIQSAYSGMEEIFSDFTWILYTELHVLQSWRTLFWKPLTLQYSIVMLLSRTSLFNG